MSLSLFVRKAVICSCFAVAGPAVVFGAAGLSPQGGEYAIAGALPGDQVHSHAAIDFNGGYLVWQDNADPRGLRIRALRLGNGLTPSGAPAFLVSSATRSKTAGNQEQPTVTLLPGGGALIVWRGGLQGRQQIWARFIDPNGVLLKKDVRVNSFTRTFAADPAVAALADGSVVVAWSSSGQDGSRSGVYGQRFSATGSRLGSEFQVNQWTLDNQRTPAVAPLAGGNFVIAWVSELQRSSTSVDVFARVFDAIGNPLTAEFPVNTTTSNACANPVVAGSPQGGFAVSWSQNDNVILSAGSSFGVPVSGMSTVRSTNSWDVFGRVFDATGAALAAPFRLNTYTQGDQFAPQLAAEGDAYLAVWTSLRQDSSWEGVFGQAFGVDGALAGSEFRANTTVLSSQFEPTVAGDGANGFLVGWSSFTVGGSHDFDLFARKYLLSTGP